MDGTEETVMIICNAGDARSSAMEAVQAANENNFEAAQERLSAADAALLEAHKHHSTLLTFEAQQKDSDHSSISLLLVHAEDQLMCASLAKDLARALVDAYKKIAALEEDQASAKNSKGVSNTTTNLVAI